MPRRDNQFSAGEYYHVFNRGVEKRVIYNDDRDYNRFLEIAAYYLDPHPLISYSQRHRIQLPVLDTHRIQVQPENYLVEIIAYCLMPNHFHFLLRVNVEKGLSNWIRLISNSYTRSYNVRWSRVGPLFQGPYKMVHIDSNEQLLHLSRYIHLNPVVAKLTNSSNDWRWSSMGYLIGRQKRSWLNPEIITKQF